MIPITPRRLDAKVSLLKVRVPDHEIITSGVSEISEILLSPVTRQGFIAYRAPSVRHKLYQAVAQPGYKAMNYVINKKKRQNRSMPAIMRCSDNFCLNCAWVVGNIIDLNQTVHSI